MKVRIPDNVWNLYKAIVNDFLDTDAGKQSFLWLKHINQLSLFGEDNNTKYIPVRLEGLFQYNFIKTWPANHHTLSGELEGENMVLYISARYLESNGYLDKYGYFNFNWSEDRFVLNGKVYKPDGDTQVAQAKDEALLFFIILKREEPEESSLILNSNIEYVEIASKTGNKSVVNTYTGLLKDNIHQILRH